MSHIPPNVDTCIIKKQSFGDIYLNSKLTHLSIGQDTTIGRIFNIGMMNSFLSYVYISEELIHPYDFGIKMMDSENVVQWLIRIIEEQNKQYHYDTYASLGSIPTKIILTENTHITPIITVFGLASNYPRRMAEFVVDTNLV